LEACEALATWPVRATIYDVNFFEGEFENRTPKN